MSLLDRIVVLEKKVAALERQLAEQHVILNLPSYTVGDLNEMLSRDNLVGEPNEPLKQTQEDAPDSHAMAEGKYPIPHETFSNLEQITLETGNVPNSQCIASKGCDLDER